MEKLARDKEYLSVVLQAVSMFIVAPIAYALVAFFIKESQPVIKPETPMLLYGLLAFALLDLFVILPIVTRLMMRTRQDTSRARIPMKSIHTVQMALVETSFILGLLYFFISWEIAPMIYFYAIGAVGVLMHWPTRERFDAVANQLEAK